ncbi:MAG: hypothetical protein U0797_29920 [Gemmataceae bacterium]
MQPAGAQGQAAEVDEAGDVEGARGLDCPQSEVADDEVERLAALEPADPGELVDEDGAAGGVDPAVAEGPEAEVADRRGVD